MSIYNPNLPEDNQPGSVLIARLFANDAMALNADPDAIIGGTPAVGSVVVFDRANGVWVKCNPDSLPENPLFGVVENVAGNKGQVRIGGVYQSAQIELGKVYYVQNDGSLGTKESDLLAGYSMSIGNLAVLFNGGGGFGSSSKGINAQYFTTAGNHTFIVPRGVKKIKVTCIGGAGGGGSGAYLYGVGGNGATGYVNKFIFEVIPNAFYTLTVGGGGNGGIIKDWRTAAGNNGGISSFGTLLSASGGAGGGAGKQSDTDGKGYDAYSYSYRTGIYPWCSIGGTGGGVRAIGEAGTAGAVIVEW